MHADLRQRLPAWKARYGELLYLPGAEGQEFVLRPFTIGEYETYKAQTKINAEAAETLLIQSCLLWPEKLDVDDLDQADFKVLVRRLADVSPFDSQDRLVKKFLAAREQVQTTVGMIHVWLSAAFPSLTPEGINQLTPDKVLYYLAIAEQILQKPVPFAPAPTSTDQKSEPVGPDAKRAERAAQIARRKEMRERRLAGLPDLAPTAEAPVAASSRTPSGGIDFERERRELANILGPDRSIIDLAANER